MIGFISFILQWLPVILHIVGAIALPVGATNHVAAATNPNVPSWATIPLMLFGGLSHILGIGVTKLSESAKKAELPTAPVGISSEAQLIGLLAQQFAQKEDPRLSKLSDLFASKAGV